MFLQEFSNDTNQPISGNMLQSLTHQSLAPRAKPSRVLEEADCDVQDNHGCNISALPRAWTTHRTMPRGQRTDEERKQNQSVVITSWCCDCPDANIRSGKSVCEARAIHGDVRGPWCGQCRRTNVKCVRQLECRLGRNRAYDCRCHGVNRLHARNTE